MTQVVDSPVIGDAGPLPPAQTDTPVPSRTFTALPPSPTYTQTVTITPTFTDNPPTPTPADVLLDGWKGVFFRQTSEDCHTPDSTCWRGATTGSGNDMSLIREGIDIPEDWANPHLVFWHKRQIGNKLTAQVSIESGAKKEIARSYETGLHDWTLEAVDLSPYKGRRVKVHFFAQDGLAAYVCTTPGYCREKNWVLGASSTWIIQDIHIAPDYSSSAQFGSLDYTPPPPAYFSSNDPFLITRWKTGPFSEVTEGCHLPGMPCWWGKGEKNGQEIFLIGEEIIYVASHWPNPHLVFWTRYSIDTSVYAIVLFKTPQADEIVRRYDPGSRDWFLEEIDLKPYLGGSFIIHFIGKDSANIPYCASIGGTAENNQCTSWGMWPGGTVEWYLQEMRIVPNHHP